MPHPNKYKQRANRKKYLDEIEPEWGVNIYRKNAYGVTDLTPENAFNRMQGKDNIMYK